MSTARQLMDGILRRYGYNIYLQRRINTTNSEKKQYSSTFERHTVRSMLGGSTNGGTNEQDEGTFHNAEMVYFFRWDANPKDGDRIYENYERDSGDVRIFLIEYAMPNRGKGGRIDFWTVGANREVID